MEKKTVAYKTAESWATVPHVSFVYEADAGCILAELQQLNKNTTVHITLNTLFLRIITEAVKAAPQVNAHITYNRRRVSGKIERRDEINISVPWLLDSGEMITVNLRNFENKTLCEMQDYIDKIRNKIKNRDIYIPLRQTCVDNLLCDLKKGRIFKVLSALTGSVFGKSRTPKRKRKDIKVYKKISAADKITKDDLAVGTITVSNIGSLHKKQSGFMALLEIIPPQVFAVGIGVVQEKAGMICGASGEKTIGIVKVAPICLAFDHRALNFNDIIPFLRKLDDIFSSGEIVREW